MNQNPPITVLGVGNPIMGDDGAGLALLEQVQTACQGVSAAQVRFVNGVTGGMELLPDVENAPFLLVLDAVAGKVPGSVVRLRGEELNRWLAGQLSPHQVGLADVLGAARLIGKAPGVVEVVGIVPETVEMRLGLSPVVAGALPAAAAAALAVLAEWGVDVAAGFNG